MTYILESRARNIIISANSAKTISTPPGLKGQTVLPLPPRFFVDELVSGGINISEDRITYFLSPGLTLKNSFVRILKIPELLSTASGIESSSTPNTNWKESKTGP